MGGGRETGYVIRPIVCRHEPEETLEELYAIVDNGGSVVNVIIEHPVYGQITCGLRISSRFEADQFVDKLEKENAPLLSQLTGGVHLHTVRCTDEQGFWRIASALHTKGFLYE